MKAFSVPALLYIVIVGLLPNAAFSSPYVITLDVSPECKSCWSERADDSCNSVCADYCDSNAQTGQSINRKPSCEHLQDLMMNYHARVETCKSHGPNMQNECNRQQFNIADAALDAAKVEHRTCKREPDGLQTFKSLKCYQIYQQCQNHCRAGLKAYSIQGNLTLYTDILSEDSTEVFENSCKVAWANSGFDQIFNDYTVERDRLLGQPTCVAQQPADPPAGGGDGTDATPPAEPDKEEPEKKDRTNSKPTNPVTQGMNALGQLSQFAQPFLMQPQPGGIGVDYSGGAAAPQQAAQPYRGVQFDSPNYFNVPGSGAMGDADAPFIDAGDSNNSKTDYKDFSGNSGSNSGGSTGGGMPAMMMGGGNMGSQSGGGSGSSSSRAVRRPKKKDRTLFSNRPEEQGPSGAFAGPVDPSATTQQVARKVGFDKNGQQIDRSFDPSKYAPKINDVYNRAINSQAMERAMRRAAGFETMSSENSRGYTDWHKTHHIHPGQLSIFKQVRICYIMKYSSTSTTCGQ